MVFYSQNGADVMAMFMTSSEAKIVESEANFIEVEKTRRAAEILSSRAEGTTCFSMLKIFLYFI